MADIKLQPSRLLEHIERVYYYEIKGIAGPDKDGSVYVIVRYNEHVENANSDNATERVLKLDVKNRRIQWLHKVTGSLTNRERSHNPFVPDPSGSVFVVSGDGTKLYFLTTDMKKIHEGRPVRNTNTLYEYDTITGIERSVAHVPDFFRHGFFVSPDGSKLLVPYWSDELPHWSDEQADSVGQVYDLKNGKVHSLASSASHWQGRTSMCFSNDGNRIVITRAGTAMVFNANTGRPLFSENKDICRGVIQPNGSIWSSCVAPIPGGYLFAFSDGFVRTDENLNRVEYMPLDSKNIRSRAPRLFMLDAQCRFGLVAWESWEWELNNTYCYVDFEEHTYCDDIPTFGSDDDNRDNRHQTILFSRDGSKLYSDYNWDDDWGNDPVWEVPLSGLPMKLFAVPRPAEPEFDWHVFNKGDN